jgi:tryptophan 2,3-dioxygenase
VSAAGDVTYGTYLHLDELLELQQPLSTPTHPDELLFIIVHQASELWFKAILHEMDGLVDAFEAFDAGEVLWRVQRINALMHIVSAQLSSLETLPPQHFAQFRRYLGTSSGSQSMQFRAIEIAAGLRDEDFIKMIREQGPLPESVEHALSRPPLQDLFMRLLQRDGTTLEALYLGPGPRLLFFVAEALLEFEQQFAEWRFKHVQLVERVIGPSTSGTGGTLGSRFLMSTIEQKFFPQLWEGRAAFFGRRSGAADGSGG